MNTITKENLWHYQWDTPVVPGEKLSGNNGVITEDQRQAWPEETDYKMITLSPRMNRTKL